MTRTKPERSTTAPQQRRQPEVAAFKAVLTGSNAEAQAGGPSGELVAVLSREPRVLRWKLKYAGLSGPVRSASFDRLGKGGQGLSFALTIGRDLTSPHEGRATLTPAQRDDLLAGRWCVSLRTAHFPAGELRGVMVEQR